MTSTLSERYGAPRPVRRRLLQGAVGLLVLAGLGWLAWAVWFESTPDVESGLSTFRVTGSHTAVAEVDVRTRSPRVRAHCVAQALARDHSVVGETAFTVTGTRGSVRRTVQIRTERPAVLVDLLGCTTPRQHRPR